MSNNKEDAASLYRRYQTERDNIPPAMLRKIMMAAKTGETLDSYQETKETQINKILHAAKISNAESQQKKDPRFSLKNCINTFIRKISTSSFGANQWAGVTAFSALLIIVVAVNLLPSSQQNNAYLDLAYLEDCHVCGQLAITSTIKTRHINLEKNTSIETTSGAARFGRLTFDLELLNDLSLESHNKRSHALISTIKRLAKEKQELSIIQYFGQFDEKHIFSKSEISELTQHLNQTFEQKIDSAFYLAGKWFERLYITINTDKENQGDSSRILSAFDRLEELQQSLKQSKKVLPNSVALNGVNQLLQLKESHHSFGDKEKLSISAIVKTVFQSLDM